MYASQVGSEARIDETEEDPSRVVGSTMQANRCVVGHVVEALGREDRSERVSA